MRRCWATHVFVAGHASRAGARSASTTSRETVYDSDRPADDVASRRPRTASSPTSSRPTGSRAGGGSRRRSRCARWSRPRGDRTSTWRPGRPLRDDGDACADARVPSEHMRRALIARGAPARADPHGRPWRGPRAVPPGTAAGRTRGQPPGDPQPARADAAVQPRRRRRRLRAAARARRRTRRSSWPMATCRSPRTRAPARRARGPGRPARRHARLPARRDRRVSIPSSDGSPNSVWEALASGVPVVASDLPQLRERLGDDVVAFIAPTPGAVAAALHDLVTRPALHARAGAAGRAWALGTSTSGSERSAAGAVYDAVRSASTAQQPLRLQIPVERRQERLRGRGGPSRPPPRDRAAGARARRRSRLGRADRRRARSRRPRRPRAIAADRSDHRQARPPCTRRACSSGLGSRWLGTGCSRITPARARSNRETIDRVAAATAARRCDACPAPARLPDETSRPERAHELQPAVQVAREQLERAINSVNPRIAVIEPV